MLIPFGYLVVIISAFGVFPTFVRVYGFSLSGIATFAVPFLASLLLMLYCRRVPYGVIISLPLLLFCLLDIFTMPFSPFTKGLIQDFFVWTGMFLVFVATYVVAHRGWNEENVGKIHLLMRIGSNVALVVCVASYFLVGQDASTPLVLLIFFAYRSALYFRKRHIASVYWMLCAILIASLMAARIVVLAELFIVVLSLYYTDFSFKKIVAMMVVLLMVSVVVMLSGARFVSAFTQGDNALSVGGVSINTSGRWFMWGELLTSISEKPLLGHGTDMPEKYKDKKRWSHPHNDYLRILHHLGFVGLILWLIFVKQLLRKLMPEKGGILKVARDEVLVLSAFLSIIGLSVAMLTDNAIVYMYVVYPVMFITAIGVVSVNKSVMQ